MTTTQAPARPRPRIEARLAAPADDADIRRLVAETAMPGAVHVRFAREPDYFLGTTIMGDPCDVLIGRATDGRLAGIACRAERRAFVNGVEERIGYVGQIRVAMDFRGQWLPHRAMAWWGRISPAGMRYVGVTARENPRARGVLVGPRPPGRLRALRLGGITTCAIVLRRRATRWPREVELATAADTGLASIVAFLREQGPRRQLYPAYTVADFEDGRTLRGLAASDVMVALQAGRIVGTMAAWDQAAYKQDIVDGYDAPLRRLRPAWDAAARLVGFPPLTPPGQAIPLAFAACVCVAGDDPSIMNALTAAAACHARARGKAYLMLGLADRDPLLAVARRWLHVTYHSDLFLFSWSDNPGAGLDDRVPYIEIATL